MEKDAENNNKVSIIDNMINDLCPTEDELILVKQMRVQVSDLSNEMRETEALIRYLRARDHDLEKAEQMLRKSVKWRLDNNVSSYLHYTWPSALKKDYIIQVLGPDKEGYPVFYVPLGRWNIRDRLKEGYLQATLEGRFHLLEGILMPTIQEYGKAQCVLIIDLKELSFYKVAHMDTMNVCGKFIQDYENHYPERLKEAYIVNTPWVFPYAFSILKPWFASKTLRKLQVFDGDKDKWFPTLKDCVPQDILPPLLLS